MANSTQLVHDKFLFIMPRNKVVKELRKAKAFFVLSIITRLMVTPK